MWKKLSRDAELTAEQARRRSRSFSVFVEGDGMYVVRGRFEPEVGAMLMRAVEAASDAVFRSEGDARDGAGSGRSVSCEAGDARPEPKHRRADAVGLLAERALAAGFGGGKRRESEGDVDEVGGDLDELDGAQTTESNAALRGAPAETPGAKAENAANTSARVGSATRAERYQVMVHCDAATLAAEGEPGPLRRSRDWAKRRFPGVSGTIRGTYGPSDRSAPSAGQRCHWTRLRIALVLQPT